MLPDDIVRGLLADPCETVIVIPCGSPPVVVATGTPEGVRVTPGQVLRAVLLAGAPAYTLVHTHPGGGPPSDSDRAVTRRLVAASAVVGVRLVAHVVLAPEGQWDCTAA